MRCRGLELTKSFSFYSCVVRFRQRWQKRKKEKRRQEQAAAPSQAEIERAAEETRARQEALYLSEVAVRSTPIAASVLTLCHKLPSSCSASPRRHQAKKKQVAARIEGRQKRKRARELDYKAQIAARLEVLLRIRRLKQGSVYRRPPPPLLPSSVSF